MEPVRKLQDVFLGEVLNEHTQRRAASWLNENYPEAAWEVRLVRHGIHVSVTFKTPKEETFYTLLWA